LVILWVRNIPVEGEECKWIYERSYIELRRKIWIYGWSSQLYTQLDCSYTGTPNLSSCEIKAWLKIQAWTGYKLMTSAILIPIIDNVTSSQMAW